MTLKITPTICRICKENCGILVSQDQDGIQGIRGNPDHPVSRGFICFRGSHFNEIRTSRERLTQPLLKVKGKWQKVSFGTAVDIMAEKFDASRREFGAQSVAFLKGEVLKHQEIKGYMRHLARAFGSPNYMSVGSLCHQSLAMGHGLTYGGIPKPDFDRIQSAVLWGTNPAASSQRLFARLKKARQDGLKLIVIDPSATKTSDSADLHLKIRPGSDGFLALAFIKTAVETYHLSADPARESGWAEFEKQIAAVSLGELLEKTGIETSEFLGAADLIFQTLPSWNLCGVALELHPAGLQTIRAIACLQSLVDPDTAPGAGLFPLNPLPGLSSYPEMADPVGLKQAPLYVQMNQEAQAMFLPDAILKDEPYPVRAMWIAGANPMLTFPGVSLHRQMFSSLDFLAVADLFMTRTAEQADLVLPAADHLDCMELHDYGAAGRPCLGLVRPVPHQGPGWPVWKWTFSLARKLGLEKFFPWETNEQAIADKLAGTGINLADLMESPASVVSYTPAAGKKDAGIHYFSTRVADAGESGWPLPSEFRLPWSVDDTFPLWLSTGDRLPVFQHSQFRQSDVYLQRADSPCADLHPKSAAAAGIKSGDSVKIITRYGTLTVKANVTDAVREDCIRMAHGWDAANVNEITGMEYFDPLSGFPWCRALPARIEVSGS